MIRIFVTGDNHIGMKYASHPKADILVKARIDAFSDMVEKANQEQCDLFVITGDLFENNYSIAKRDVQALLKILSLFHGTVAVLPGNHDYYDLDVQTKLWQYFTDSLTGTDNIMLMNEYRPYTIEIGEEQAVLYPAFCTTLHSQPNENNLGWIKSLNITADEVYKIGIAHGSIEGETIDQHDEYFKMSRTELEAIPVDLWFIGHTHVPFPRDLSDEFCQTAERIFNPGTHVQTDVSCGTEGNCFIIELDSGTGQKNMRVKKYVSGKLRFYRKEVTVFAGEMERELEKSLSGIDDNSVVDLRISGAVTMEEYENKDGITEKVLSRFLEGTYNHNGLSKLITKELIDAEFPETSFSAGLLTELLGNSKQAQLAYELLRSVREGK